MNDPSVTAEPPVPASRKKLATAADRSGVFSANRGVMLSVAWSTPTGDLARLSSTLDSFRLVVRRARKQGMSVDEFLNFLAARNRAEELAREALRAQTACDQLLGKSVASRTQDQ